MVAKTNTEIGFQSEVPEELFTPRMADMWLQMNTYKYTITPDGKNIIAVKRMGDAAQSNLVLVENWYKEFKDKN